MMLFRDKPYKSSEGIIRQGIVRPWNSESGPLLNDIVDPVIILPAGYPVQEDTDNAGEYQPLTATAFNAIADVDGILLNEFRVFYNKYQQVSLIRRGKGLVVNLTALPQTGFGGIVDFDQARWKVVLDQLGFKWYEETVSQEIQDR